MNVTTKRSPAWIRTIWEKIYTGESGGSKTPAGILQQCENIDGKPVTAKIMNLGATVNTSNSEYVPVISTDDSVMLFTYRGERSRGGLQSYPGQADSAGIYFED